MSSSANQDFCSTLLPRVSFGTNEKNGDQQAEREEIPEPGADVRGDERLQNPYHECAQNRPPDVPEPSEDRGDEGLERHISQ